ncbi:MAG: hypothetical protein J0M12_07415 [Deltaproteobacteria bacterium]|nr:hypothetical protein [Deltaproteobacteria bacterium]
MIRRFQGALLLGLCSALLVGSASDCHAQSPDKNKGFFDKNFAETPLKKREGGRFPDGSFPTPKSEPQTFDGTLPPGMTAEQMEQLLKDPKTAGWQKEMGIVKPTISPMKADEQQGDLTGLMRALPVRSIGGVLNSADAEHYEKSLQQLSEFAEKKNLDVGTIYTLGDMKTATNSPFIPKLVARGGVVRIVSNIPKGYDVSLSPTWVVKTSEGEVLLEAVGSLDKYFNPQGEFLDRETRAKKPAAATEKKVQGSENTTLN